MYNLSDKDYSKHIDTLKLKIKEDQDKLKNLQKKKVKLSTKKPNTAITF